MPGVSLSTAKSYSCPCKNGAGQRMGMDMLWSLLSMTRKTKGDKKKPSKICLITHFFLPALFPARSPPASWVAQPEQHHISSVCPSSGESLCVVPTRTRWDARCFVDARSLSSAVAGESLAQRAGGLGTAPAPDGRGV